MTDEREEGDEGDGDEEDEELEARERTAVLKRRRDSQPVDGAELNAPGLHRLRPSEAPALDPAAATGMIPRPLELADNLPAEAPGTGAADWRQTGKAKFFFGLLIGLASGGILGIMATPDDVTIIPTEPLPVKTVAPNALAIALTPEEKVKMFPATSTVTLTEMEQILCRREPEPEPSELLPDLIPVQNAKPAAPICKPVYSPVSFCKGRRGQKLSRCCEVMAENLPEYETEFARCIEGGEP